MCSRMLLSCFIDILRPVRLLLELFRFLRLGWVHRLLSLLQFRICGVVFHACVERCSYTSACVRSFRRCGVICIPGFKVQGLVCSLFSQPSNSRSNREAKILDGHRSHM